MLPIRMGVLEFGRPGRRDGRRQPERLSQCLGCGALLWSRSSGEEPECRCVAAELARLRQLSPVPA